MSDYSQWEEVCDESEGFHIRRVLRMEVPGGWLYLFEAMIPVCNDFNNYCNSLQFVPKPCRLVKLRKKL